MKRKVFDFYGRVKCARSLTALSDQRKSQPTPTSQSPIVAILLLTAFLISDISVAYARHAASTSSTASPPPQAAEEKPDFAFDVSLPVVLQKEPGVNHFRTGIDIGTLPSGENGQLTLTVSNPTTEIIEFASTSGTCACSQIKTSAFVIAPGGEIKLQVHMRTPDRVERPEGVVSFLFVDSLKTPVLEIHATYQLAGLLRLLEQAATVRVPFGETVGEQTVRLLATEPIDIAQVKVESTESLRDLVFKVEPGQNISHIRITASSLSVEDGALAGELIVLDPTSGRRSSMMITVEQSKPLTVRPLVIWFRPVPEEGEGVFKASALLSLDSNSQLTTESETAPPQSLETASADGEALVHEVDFGGKAIDLPTLTLQPVRLNPTTCRMVCILKLTPEELQALRKGDFSRKGEIEWFAAGKEGRFATTTRFELMDR